MHYIFKSDREEEVKVCLSVCSEAAAVTGGRQFWCFYPTRFLHWPSSQSLKLSDGITGDNRTVVHWLDVNHNNTAQANHESLIMR